MNHKIVRTLGLLCLLSFSFHAVANAQGIGTPEYEMNYGREAFGSRKYAAATTYFRSAIHLDPQHAEAHYLLGVSLLKMGEVAQARSFLEKAARLDSKYQTEVTKLLQKNTTAAGKNSGANPKTTPKTSIKPNIVGYQVGDSVEVFYAGQWNPGKVIAVEGRGTAVYAKVNYTFQGDKRTASFFYNGLRPAAKLAQTEKNNKDTQAKTGLTLGIYGCSSKQWSGGNWVFTPRGSFRLLANGKYTQTNGGGSYRYNASTKEIAFKGGFFNNAKGKVISNEQIDIHFTPNYWWTGALQR